MVNILIFKGPSGDEVPFPMRGTGNENPVAAGIP